METLILIIVLSVLFVAVVAETGWLLLVRPRRRRGAAPTEVVAPPEAPQEPEQTAPGQDTPAAQAAQAVMTPPAPPAPQAPPAPEIEKPPPSAGRLVRLRSRLARSQSTMGSTLLGPLSRERLDEGTWGEIEEALIAADVGVGPAPAIVDDARTNGQVLGVR